LYFVLLISFDPNIENLHMLVTKTIIPRIRKRTKRLLLESTAEV
jgi:hypothetical protein